jgi:hypothetical protein
MTYDVLGELCFGKSFNLLIDGAKRNMVHLVDRAAYRHYVVSYSSLNIIWVESNKVVRPLDASRQMGAGQNLHPETHYGPMELYHEVTR